MYRSCKTEESAARQRKVEQCLLEMMKQTPYAKISIGELAARAGISRVAFYRYFDSKDGCLCAMLDHMMTDIALFEIPAEYSQYQGSYRSLRLCSYWIHLKPLLDLLERNHLSRWLVERNVIHVNREITDLAQKIGVQNTPLQEDMLNFAAGGSITMLYYWYLRGFDRSVPEMARLLEQLLNMQLSADIGLA